MVLLIVASGHLLIAIFLFSTFLARMKAFYRDLSLKRCISC
jgi:hypothetical protein